jgi:hypothetical protein
MMPAMPDDPEEAAPRESASEESPGPGAVPSTEDVPSSAGAEDSLLRAVAGISEPSASAVEMARAHAPLAAGRVVGKRYRLDRELGRGGMGVVWAATHLVTRRPVAIKFLLSRSDSQAELRRRFLREARAASAVDHPNVVEVLDVFELEDETSVIVMELLLGETLRERLVREGKLPLAHTVSLLLPVVAAVRRAHTLGIVHRDLKPENIFLSSEPDGLRVKVLDFGIAKLVGVDADGQPTDPITGTGSTLGTPCYMAPEQALGEKDIDQRADIWAFGVILYECLAGVRPIEGSGIGQVVMKLATEGIAPLDQVVPGLPPQATALVTRMLARERGARPKDLQEVHEALSPFAAWAAAPVAVTAISGPLPRQTPARPLPAPPVDTHGATALPRRTRAVPRRSVLLGVAAVAVLVTAFAGWRHGAVTVPAAPSADERTPTVTAATAFPATAAAVLPPAATATLPATSQTISPAPAASHESAEVKAEPLAAPRKAPKTSPSASIAPSASAPMPPPPTPQPAKARGLAEKPPF